MVFEYFVGLYVIRVKDESAIYVVFTIYFNQNFY